MKDFVRQLRSSRLQRGMSRFAVTCTLLVMITIAALTVGYKKLSTPAHALPVAHGTPATRGCGCLGISQKTALTGSWTPAASTYTRKEIATMPNVLLLQAGASLPLSLATAVEGTWEAKFGAVDANGNYTAPPYTPPAGEDVITFKGSGEMSYKTLTLRIRVLPNPAIPGSSQTPYIVAAPVASVDKYGEEQRIGGSPTIVFPKSAPLPPAQFLRTITVVQPGEKPVPPVQVTQAGPALVSNDKAAYILPAVNEVGDATDAVRVGVQTIGFIPQQAKELPQLAGNPNNNPDPHTNTETKCVEGTTDDVYSAYTETTTQGPIVSAGELTVDAGMQKAALPLTINLHDKITVNEIFTNYTRTRMHYVYKCINGERVHILTYTCSANTVGYFIDPQWAAPFVGRKPGHIIEPYPADVCH